MGRIRTIKPEFPHSEQIGRISRDARLLFLQLFTLVDDEGRTRAASRLLASLLYPLDDDAAKLIDGWLAELERENLARRYRVDGTTYLFIVNWLKHQKIDHPSKSRLPAPSDDLAKPREASRTLAPDLGSRILDLGSDDDVGDAKPAEKVGQPEEAKKVGQPAWQLTKGHELAKQIAAIAGRADEFEFMGWSGATRRAQQWLDAGWPEDLVIEAVRQVMRAKRDGPPSSIKYFEPGIAKYLAQQNAPLPVVVELPAITVGVTHGKAIRPDTREPWQKRQDAWFECLDKLSASVEADRQRAARRGEGGDGEIIQDAAAASGS